MTNNINQTYDFLCFTDLVYEFDVSKKKEVEKKIKRRLKYYKLGEYNQERVDYIRQLKNELYSEIAQTTQSKYFHKLESNYTELADFDVEQMTIDYHTQYNTIDKNELMEMIKFAIYLYHLR